MRKLRDTPNDTCAARFIGKVGWLNLKDLYSILKIWSANLLTAIAESVRPFAYFMIASHQKSAPTAHAW